MADRVSASITIGGDMTAAIYQHLADAIADEGLSTEWDGATFAPDQRIEDEPLRLYAHEVPWGRFAALEAFCVAHSLPFARWAGGYGCEWSPEIVVFTGSGEPTSYLADENERTVIDRYTIDELGSLDAVRAYFDAADFAPPPLRLTG